MATKQINISSDSFAPKSTDVNKNQDSVHFVQSGPNAPATVTLSSGTLFGVTTCTVDPNSNGTSVYPVLPGASGDYTVSLPPGLRGGKESGTIKVTG